MWIKKHWLLLSVIILLSFIWIRAISLIMNDISPYDVSYSGFLLTALVVVSGVLVNIVRNLFRSKRGQ